MDPLDLPRVEYVSDTEVRIRALTPDVQEVAISLSPSLAGELGGALLATSAVCSTQPPKPSPGTRIREALLPVVGWESGVSSVNGMPILILRFMGGATLAFQFPAEGARVVADALQAEGKRAADEQRLTEALKASMLEGMQTKQTDS